MDKTKEKQEVGVTPEMVEAALYECENWTSFDSGPGAGAMEAVLRAAFLVYEERLLEGGIYCSRG